MKVCVYAIAKDEEKFVERWVHSVREADAICVLDTGSTDNTVERLADLGVIVRQEAVSPWRFDAARNLSLELVPEDTDVCVCVDLDDVLSPGWRAALERAWQPWAEKGRYMSIRDRCGDGTPGTSFLMDKIHRPGLFRWKYPVHEILERADSTQGIRDNLTVDVPELVVEHMPDLTKSRAQYLPLLELAARENPQDARCAHYLGREYMYYGRYGEAIRELERHLALPSATWEEQRAASMRYLSACHAGLGDHETAMRWALRAVAEAPELRENWYAAEKAAYHLDDWGGVLYFGQAARDITARSDSGINEAEAWGAAVYDLLSLACWHTGQRKQAIHAAEAALAVEPDNERIQGNLAFYRASLGQKEQASADPAGICRAGVEGGGT